jgi:hypothetical protein
LRHEQHKGVWPDVDNGWRPDEDPRANDLILMGDGAGFKVLDRPWKHVAWGFKCCLVSPLSLFQ